MTTTSVDETTLSSPPEPIGIPPAQEAIDKRPSLEPENSEQGLLPPPPLSQASRGESNIIEIDPNAFKITILSAASGYRRQISVNRELLEKAASAVEGDGFLVSQLKNAIWTDWPSGITFTLYKDRTCTDLGRLARSITTKSKFLTSDLCW
jgi:hypothetical protein